MITLLTEFDNAADYNGKLEKYNEDCIKIKPS